MKYKVTLDFGPEEAREPLELPDPSTITFGPPHEKITPEAARSFWQQHKDDLKLAPPVRDVAEGKLVPSDVWFAWRDDPRIVERGFDMLDVIYIVMYALPDLFRVDDTKLEE